MSQFDGAHVLARPARGCQGCCFTFQRDAEFEAAQKLCRIGCFAIAQEIAHGTAANITSRTLPGIDDAISTQTRQRLSDHRPGDLEHAAEIVFAGQSIAFGQRAGDNAFDDLFIDPVTQLGCAKGRAVGPGVLTGFDCVVHDLRIVAH